MNAPPSSPQASIYQALCQLPVNEFDLQALLYPAGSHLLTTRQLETLLTYTKGDSVERLAPSEVRVLDVGAGDGCITKNLKALGLRLVATETSLGMATRLRMNGYEVWCEEQQLKDAMKRDIAETVKSRTSSESESFSLISMLNVLDRCASPRRLCAAAHELLSPGGHVLLASPLPFVASYYGPETQWSGDPVEKLQLHKTGDEGTWESDAELLLRNFLPSCGFEPVAISRLPYLLNNEESGGCLELDDIIVLARKGQAP
eukprot:Skav201951  [mRNA]  locus=scaffold103:15867:16922:- [translate_table: standard]